MIQRSGQYQQNLLSLPQSAKIMHFLDDAASYLKMSKISSVSGQQRLLKLAKSQLGTSIHPPEQTTEKAAADSSAFSSKHQQLAARSGITLNAPSDMNIAQRAERRLQIQKEKQQQNLESIMLLALDYCPEHVSQQEVDPDWFQQFCELVLNISNRNMQQLWAKILAGEIASPGKFSLKTLLTLKQMSYKEALALQLAANLSCRSRQEFSARIYFGYLRKPSLWQWLTGRSKAMLNLSQFGLTYPQILSLMDIGLLHNSEIESGELNPSQQLNWQYQQLSLNCTPNSKGVVLQYYKYTPMGAELLPLLAAQPNQIYLTALKQLLSDVMDFH
ncbi:TIGR03899 family protein [Chromatiaceae bacterium AAb-1]|nr:TIGR03899 family protein [Chromatiaceae bacterium AAb-1]